MCNYKIDAEVVLRLAAGRWDEILYNLAPVLRPALERAPRHVPCPIHGGENGFRFFKDYKQTGQCICNTCGAFNGFSILMKVNSWDFVTALKAVAQFLQMPDGIESNSRIEAFDGKVISMGMERLRTSGQCFCLKLKLENGRTSSCWGNDLRRACAEAGIGVGDNARICRLGTKLFTYKGKECRKVLWSARKTASDAEIAERLRVSEAEAARREVSISTKWDHAFDVRLSDPAQRPLFLYLKVRGICPDSPEILKNIRFLSDEPYFDEQGNAVGRFPCMLAAVRNSTGELVTLHRTYLTRQGVKIGFAAAKKLMPVPAGKTINGAFIGFGEVARDGILCLAEGIETALSVQVATGYPCLSCISAQGLASYRFRRRRKLSSSLLIKTFR